MSYLNLHGSMTQHFTALVAVLLLVAPAAGQQAQAEPAPLTLADALERARENNPAYGVLAANLQAADAQERTANSWLRYLPNVSFGLGATVTQSRVLTGTDEFGRPVRLDEPISYRRTDSNVGPSISQITLFDGGQGLRDARSTRAGVRGSRAQVAAAAMQLESELIRSYYTAVRVERQIELDELLLESTRLNFEAAQRLLRVGIQDPLDVISAELAVAQVEHRLEQARGEARKARLALADAMGIGREVDFTLADELPPVFDPSTLDVEAMIASALEGNPALGQLEASSEQSRYSLLSARAAIGPGRSRTRDSRQHRLPLRLGSPDRSHLRRPAPPLPRLRFGDDDSRLLHRPHDHRPHPPPPRAAHLGATAFRRAHRPRMSRTPTPIRCSTLSRPPPSIPPIPNPSRTSNSIRPGAPESGAPPATLPPLPRALPPCYLGRPDALSA